MASEVGICNRALQRVGAARITSLADDNKNARACNAAYESLRDAALRSHPWSFAISRAALAADVTAPVGDGDELRSYQYPWPTDALRILLPKDNSVDWIVEGRYILSDWTAPLYIRYIAQITDPNTMDPLFREYLSAYIAQEICEELTQSNNKKLSAQQDMIAIVAEARRTNAIERLPASPPDGTWDTVRS
jgi:hypothetical protein